jgi:hypothetical protein
MFDLDEETESGNGGEWIVNAVYVGDNVVVIVKSEIDE